MNQQTATVCAWCTPKAELERMNRENPNISHGMCPSCFEKQMQEIAAMKAKRGAK